MKKKLLVVACLVLACMMLTGCGRRQKNAETVTVTPAESAAPAPTAAVPEPTAEPTPEPAVTPAPTAEPVPTLTPTAAPAQTAAPTPVPTAKPAANLPVVKKDPTGETVASGGKCQFVTRYENAKYAEWHFVSPDGTSDLDYAQAQKKFATLKIVGGDTKDLTLDKIPAELNGWKVYCRFSNAAGSVNTAAALITVTGTGGSAASAANLPRITKSPTGETVEVNGKCQFVTRYENAKYAEWHFVSPDGTRDLDYAQAQKKFATLKILGGDTKDLTLDKIPAELNGWKVYCRFSNAAGSVNTAAALITVTGTGGSAASAANLPRITKSPTGETVEVNGKCQFVTRYENAKYAEWHFVSPDGTRDLDYTQAQKEFPTMKITGGNTKDLTLGSIPAEINGWKVYCRFTNNAGSADSGSALITVKG